jgi:hypothetical protein
MKVKAMIALEVREECYPAAARVRGVGSDSSKGESCTFNG